MVIGGLVDGKRLRTLKDLDLLVTHIFPVEVDSKDKIFRVDTVDIFDLRGLAREWVKELKRIDDLNTDDWNTSEQEDALKDSYLEQFFCGDSEYPGETCKNLVGWIRHFFNLVEE